MSGWGSLGGVGQATARRGSAPAQLGTDPKVQRGGLGSFRLPNGEAAAPPKQIREILGQPSPTSAVIGIIIGISQKMKGPLTDEIQKWSYLGLQAISQREHLGKY